MKISAKLIKAWNEKRTRGDIRRLTEYTKASKPTIIKAVTHGEATEAIILKISIFYSEKKLATPQEIELKALNIISNAKAARQNIRTTSIN
ncbi:MAG: hypothetical protein M3Z26_00415 [Bacteroidota bacterium]|nr:hypothetical protein [Bacteroidota bacterium]